jgi:hypothetical protein
MRLIRDIFRDYAVLDTETGRHINGTDKQSNHAYGDAYERILLKPDQSKGYHEVDSSFCSSVAPNAYVTIRSDVKLMMEVGIADGSSLLAWSEVFPNALCVGLDIHHADKAHGEHIEFHLGDQRSREDCERAAAGRQFDLIVEDATHRLEDTLRTLLFLWPHVRPGGLYVVEEFANIGALRGNVAALWPNANIVDTVGPSGGVEPLVVFRKPR